MSEPRSDARGAEESSSPSSPRAIGVVLLGGGLVSRFVFDHDERVGLIGFVVAMVGLALAVFSTAANRDRPISPTAPRPQPAPSDGRGGPFRTQSKGPSDDAMDLGDGGGTPMPARRTLGLGGLALCTLGVAKLAWDALHLTRTQAAWLPIVAGAFAMGAAFVWWALDDGARATERAAESLAESRWRRWIVLGTCAALGALAWIPATYYLGEDRFDERFSWRMFSAVRVYECGLDTRDLRDGTEQPVALAQTLHVAWINTMRRGRSGVIERYLRWRCEDTDNQGARVVTQCRTPEGQRLPDAVWEIDCASGRIAHEAPQ